MVEMIENKNFYPTPPALIDKMIAKIKGYPFKILEPSAGKGDIVEAIGKHYGRGWGGSGKNISVIEIDTNLQATLRGHSYKLIDTDFLAYAGPDKFDLIIANPPFDSGEKHLLKAIEIMYSGQIIFLLNAETIRNPHTNTRKQLVKKLKELKADISYIKNAFAVAERTTKVEVALVSITIERKMEDDLFAGCKDRKSRAHQTIKDKHEVTNGQTLEEMVADYNNVVQIGTETLVNFYRNYNKIGGYLAINSTCDKNNHSHRSAESLTAIMQSDLNQLLQDVRHDYWRKILDLNEFKSRMTKKKRDEFEESIKTQCFMDFTTTNIRQFMINLIGNYEKILTDAVLDIFDMFTIRHCYGRGVHEENIHYYNGWKTNNAFKVGKKVIIPIYGSYDGAFFRDAKYSFAKWELNYAAAATLHDIDTVMRYFDGGGRHSLSISDAITRALGDGKRDVQTSNIKSTYFTIRVFKKNTIHLTFNDEDILRRFNVVACRGKNWLPGDFGAKPYDRMTPEEQAVVEAFEGMASYNKHVGQPLFAQADSLAQIGYQKAA